MSSHPPRLETQPEIPPPQRQTERSETGETSIRPPQPATRPMPMGELGPHLTLETESLASGSALTARSAHSIEASVIFVPLSSVNFAAT